MCDNLDDEEKKHLEKEDNKRQKEQRDNLHDNEKEQLRKQKKEKLCVIVLGMMRKIKLEK